MPISMFKTYDTDRKRNGQGKDGTVNFPIFAYSRAIKSDYLLQS